MNRTVTVNTVDYKFHFISVASNKSTCTEISKYQKIKKHEVTTSIYMKLKQVLSLLFFN